MKHYSMLLGLSLALGALVIGIVYPNVGKAKYEVLERTYYVHNDHKTDPDSTKQEKSVQSKVMATEKKEMVPEPPKDLVLKKEEMGIDPLIFSRSIQFNPKMVEKIEIDTTKVAVLEDIKEVKKTLP